MVLEQLDIYQAKKKRIQTQNLHLSQKLTEYKSEYERKNVKF